MNSCVLLLISAALLPASEAVKIAVSPEVTGFTGHDVTLPCGLEEQRTQDSISQVQWVLQQPHKESKNILVSKDKNIVHNNQSSVSGRVELSDQSLIVKNVGKSDAGSYTCILTTFPHGSLRGSTTLVVQEASALTPATISAVVIGVLLLITAAVVYLVLTRRRRSRSRHRVFVDTSGSAAAAVGRRSVLAKEQDVVYSHLQHQRSGNAAPPSHDRSPRAAGADDVTYSEVAFL